MKLTTTYGLGYLNEKNIGYILQKDNKSFATINNIEAIDITDVFDIENYKKIFIRIPGIKLIIVEEAKSVYTLPSEQKHFNKDASTILVNRNTINKIILLENNIMKVDIGIDIFYFQISRDLYYNFINAL